VNHSIISCIGLRTGGQTK